jgi:hypothetical protein
MSRKISCVRLATLFICVAVIGFVPALFFIYPWLNNRKLYKFERSFTALKHQPGTTSIKQASRVGLLVGNGDHCDYFVGEIRTYSGNPKSIGTFYSTTTLPSPHGNRRSEPPSVVFLKNGDIAARDTYHLPSGLQSIKDWELPAGSGGKNLYLVFFLEPGDMNAGCDIRCL